MEQKFLSQKALEVINHYKNFVVGTAVCSVPYYNNRHVRARAKLRAQVGKGNLHDISEELENLAAKEKISLTNIDTIALKKFMVDHGVGIDCSGLAFHILNEESQSRNKGMLEKNLHFPLLTGIMGALRAKLRPAENAGVGTFAHEKNSREIKLTDALPGDIITMVGGPDNAERDHILVIHQVDYENSIPKIIYYTHAIAWPTDGEYGHGVRQGLIEITDATQPITSQKWLENGKIGEENYTFSRAQKSTTTLRRLLFL